MLLPTLRGIIDRRLLLNYRVRPDVLQKLLPAPFRPQLVGGWGIAGICLIRLEQLRPRYLPRWCGLSSENAAYRVAVEWNDAEGHTRCGVYVPQRQTSSRLAATIGSLLFPLRQSRAAFIYTDIDGRIQLEITDRQQRSMLRADAGVAEHFPADSVFGSLEESSDFFRRGACGYSPGRTSAGFDGVELVTSRWSVEPLRVNLLHSDYFDDRNRFPAGSIEFDHALLMRGIEHEWRGISGKLRSQSAECRLDGRVFPADNAVG